MAKAKVLTLEKKSVLTQKSKLGCRSQHTPALWFSFPYSDWSILVGSHPPVPTVVSEQLQRKTCPGRLVRTPSPRGGNACNRSSAAWFLFNDARASPSIYARSCTFTPMLLYLCDREVGVKGIPAGRAVEQLSLYSRRCRDLVVFSSPF